MIYYKTYITKYMTKLCGSDMVKTTQFFNQLCIKITSNGLLARNSIAYLLANDRVGATNYLRPLIIKIIAI